jgi:predicted  nucleic acid-binding Zn-ribbon protein
MVNYGYSRPALSGNFFRDSDNTQIVARREERPGNIAIERTLNAGQNPPNGMIVYYTLASKPEGEVKLSFLDEQGNEIKSFASQKERKPAADPTDEEEEKEKKEPYAPKEVGLNRFIWDMRYPDPRKVAGYVASEGVLAGPQVAPGTYHVRLTVGDSEFIETFEVRADPRVRATREDLEAQLALHLKIRDKLSETHDAINTLRNVRQQIDDWLKRTQEQAVSEQLTRVGKSAKEKLKAIEDELIQTKAKTRQDTLNHPVKLNGKLAGLAGVVANAQAAPTKQAYEVFDDLSQRIDVQLKQLQEVLDTDVATFNTLLRENNVPGVIPLATLNGKNGSK